MPMATVYATSLKSQDVPMLLRRNYQCVGRDTDDDGSSSSVTSPNAGLRLRRQLPQRYRR